jgi:hypothetical protein
MDEAPEPCWASKLLTLGFGGEYIVFTRHHETCFDITVLEASTAERVWARTGMYTRARCVFALCVRAPWCVCCCCCKAVVALPSLAR